MDQATGSGHGPQPRRGARTELEFHGKLLDAVGQAVIVNDAAGRITYWNTAAALIYGWTAAEALGQESLMLVADRDEAPVAEIVETLLADRTWTGDLVARRKDGTQFPVLISNSAIRGGDGKIVAIISIGTDITERRRLELAVEADRNRLAEAQRIAGLGSFEMDLATGEVRGSEQLERIMGVREGEVLTASLIVRRVAPEDRAMALAATQRAVDTGEDVDVEHRIVLPDGSVRWIWVQAQIDDDRRTIVGTALDITDLKLAQEQAAHQELHDPLTDLPNRVLLRDRLERVTLRHQQSDQDVSVVLCLGIDHFKLVNDAMGHDVGDELLTAVAARLVAANRSADTVARYSGDQFVVVQEGMSDEGQAVLAAQAICDTLSAPFSIAGHELFVTVSMGVALIEDRSGEEALRDADAAMHRAKAEGRNRVAMAEEPAQRRAAHRLETQGALRHAVERGELRLHYQPILDLGTTQIVGFEALVRWQHPTRGLLPPSEFIGLAEQTGIIVPVGRWVVAEAIEQLATWRQQHPDLPELSMSVNLSAHQLRVELADDLADLIADHEVPPESVHLEITESILMDDVDRAIENLVGLKATGVMIEVDDFGTGYSSLSYLRRFPIDALKVDQSFVNGLDENLHDAAIVRAIVSVGHALDLVVIAEGIETYAQRDRLRDLGCDLGQGFLWSRPRPADEAAELLVRPRRS